MTELKPAKHSKELANAIYDDWKRKVVDDAKKRAVGQHVDYDTFKNMVSVAHLRPLQAANMMQRDVMLPSWKYNADGSAPSAEQEAAAAAAVAMLQREPTEAASSSGDFYREWRRNCPTPDAKYRYLHLCGPAALASIFKVEISSEVLKDLVAVLEACWLGHAGAAEDGSEGSALQEAQFAIQVLQAVKSAGRFGLTVKLMGSASKKVLESLFSQLEGAVQAASAAQEASEELESLTLSEGAAEGGEAQEAARPSRPAKLLSADELAALKADYGLQ